MRADVMLQFWLTNRDGVRVERAKWRRYERAIDAVRDAWQFRPATLSPRGVLTVELPSGARLRQRVRVDGAWLRPETWRTLKALLVSQQEFPRSDGLLSRG